MKATTKMIGLIVSGVMVLSLAACSTSTSGTSSNTPAPTNAPTASVAAPTSAPKSGTTAATAVDASKYGAAGAKIDQNLTLEKMLTYAIQDEYLAQGEYDYIMKTFGTQRPFDNIITAEDRHIQLLTDLFKKYNFTLPQNAAKELVPHPKNIEESFTAGVNAEIGNIAMYETFLKQQLPDDVKAVFTELRDGSKNHLASFQKGPRGQ